jgi:hypothetical protein
MIPLCPKGANGPFGNAMQRVDGFYLYTVGSQIHPLAEITTQGIAPIPTYESLRFTVYVAESALETLLTRSIFRLKISYQSGQTLLAAIRRLKSKIEDTDTDTSKSLEWLDAYNISSALIPFEAVLGAELSLVPLYVVAQKAGYDTVILIDNGAVCFPNDVWTKAPEAAADLQQGTKCIAYEVFTASGFHFHRANEAVLRKYWDAASKGKPRPSSRNIADYLNEMDKQGFGDPRVKTALRDLKDLHRNPLIHPEHSLNTAEEAIALMNGVHNVMVYMLQEIPAITPTPTLPASGSGPVHTLSTPIAGPGGTSST